MQGKFTFSRVHKRLLSEIRILLIYKFKILYDQMDVSYGTIDLLGASTGIVKDLYIWSMEGTCDLGDLELGNFWER